MRKKPRFLSIYQLIRLKILNSKIALLLRFQTIQKHTDSHSLLQIQILASLSITFSKHGKGTRLFGTLNNPSS